MGRHTATVAWEGGDGEAFRRGRYSRAHLWRFDGGAKARASAAPANVPAPFSDAAAVDPEEAFVAAIASCHMLWFLDLARRDGLVVAAYEDAAEGVLEPDAEGRSAITRVTLRPAIAFRGETPAAERLAALHARAHAACFIANSVRTEIVVEAEPARTA